MINLVVALKCEAMPLVEHFRLRRRHTTGEISIYSQEQLRLVVTGPGKTAAAAGTALLHAMGNGTEQLWMNIGIAGHRDLEVGTGVRATCIVDYVSGHRWYPLTAVPLCGTGKTICTVDAPELRFPGDMVYDMEASGFSAAAARLGHGEMIQCYKVISDNRATGTGAVTPAAVEALVGPHVSGIAQGLNALVAAIDAATSLHNSEQLIRV